MGLGFGSLKQMNDTLKYNRDLLGKKKSVREIYKEEIKKRVSNHDNQNLENIRLIVSERLKRNKVQEIFVRITSMVIILLIISSLIWFLATGNFTVKKPGKYDDKSVLFTTKTYQHSTRLTLKTDYFINGPKAAETLYLDSLKHQNSESYYESGEQFRSALYYYDTLIREIYFFKTGDTIKNFPKILDNDVHRISILNKTKTKKIEFDFYDGKIIQDTYKENPLASHSK